MLQNINIFTHILFGTIAIFIGLVPYFTQKGGHYHRLFGRIFLGLMAIVIITALNGVLFFRDRPFLTIVTLLSLYTSYSGYRVLKTKDAGFMRQDFAVRLIFYGMLRLFIIY